MKESFSLELMFERKMDFLNFLFQRILLLNLVVLDQKISQHCFYLFQDPFLSLLLILLLSSSFIEVHLQISLLLFLLALQILLLQIFFLSTSSLDLDFFPITFLFSLFFFLIFIVMSFNNCLTKRNDLFIFHFLPKLHWNWF